MRGRETEERFWLGGGKVLNVFGVVRVRVLNDDARSTLRWR